MTAAADLAAPARLVDRDPRVRPEQLVAELVPPPRFGDVRFSTYVPDPAQPTQAQAVERLGAFGQEITAGGGGGGGGGLLGMFRRGRSAPQSPGRYLDGGFGVGKTHLLSSLFHQVSTEGGRPAAYGTFVEYTNLVGALGFRPAVDALGGNALVCIDEFELDDPGDTVLMSRLMRELVDRGVRLAATSNTLPDALGEGRFAAQDFQREIQALASQFEVLRVDGEDYRHRGLPAAPQPLPSGAVAEVAAAQPGATLDSFTGLLEHLSRVHPSRYGAMVEGVTAVCVQDVTTVADDVVGLRLVVLADRLYDRDIPVVPSGEPFDRLFTEALLRGGYRKKYLRAVSRLSALAREGASLRR
ncbi:cell division protein ZapE [Kineococcus xinjiangensis]|uniref:Cell division protein ZapE n=1 Tax=Kineococcus xinjiangensis TaxID=512762 RepID=A0A2S6IP68_9ACTN|nr:cell division protein ZapE [Kineococcus xinjiangensis]PPK95930.1 cell division protein ZapE [Kineococcus xinjiangensis]